MLDGEPAKGKKRGRARNAPQFDLRTQLFKMCGVVDGLSPDTSRPEDGLGLAKGQACGLARPARLCPGTKITGGLGVRGKGCASSDCAPTNWACNSLPPNNRHENPPFKIGHLGGIS